MSATNQAGVASRPCRRALPALGLLLLAGAAGCGRQVAGGHGPGDATAPRVQTVRPERRTLSRTVEQPARIQAFEQAPLHARVSGYVREVHVEIGQRVGKDELLAELDVPERQDEVKVKEGQVTQARIQIRQAGKALEVARANCKATRSLVAEAAAALKRAEAHEARWKSEHARIALLVSQKILDEQSGDEALKQYQSATAALEEARARARTTEASREESVARRDKAAVDVEAATNRRELAEAEWQQAGTLLGFARITAPFPGVVSQRHVDTGHFVQPPSGGSTTATPLFVVVRTDKVRVFLDVPEADAVLVHPGSPGHIRVQALNDEEFPGKVAGVSWSLQREQRTLRTEIDFLNPGEKLRPGMYAHAILRVKQPNAWTLPSATVLTRDGQDFCFLVVNGKAVRTPVRVGARQGGTVEALKKQLRPARPGEAPRWVNFTGDEAVIANPKELSDGQEVRVSASPSVAG